MSHPFSITPKVKPLNDQQACKVKGGVGGYAGRKVVGPLKPVKPPVLTTHACGEEGGCFPQPDIY